MPSLYVTQGRDQGKRLELTTDPLRLGRDADNHFQVHDTEVSRWHAELQWDGTACLLVDVGSSNGTFVNEERIERHVLRNGDRIRLGRTTMIFTGTAEPQRESAASPVDVVVSQTPVEESRIVRTVEPGVLEHGPESEEDGALPMSGVRRNLAIMYHTALAVSHTLDIDQLLERIVELIFEWVDADRGCVMLIDRETDEWIPKVRRDRNDDEADTIAISRTILEYVREHQEGVLTSDAQEDGRFDSARSIFRMGVREAICVPMQGRYGMVGAIYIDTYSPPTQAMTEEPQQRFHEDHLKLMAAIGHQAALAIEDTTYYSALVQAERLAAIGQTIASLSHHIKNILQGIRGGSYLIDEGLQANDSDAVRRGWSIVEKNQDRISNLVMDMLSFSKARKPERRPGQLNELVQDVVDMVSARAAESQVSLHVELETDLPEMVYDADGIHRAILNVVTNALDACESSEHPRLLVETAWDREAKELQVLVADNGAGIDPADHEKIFSVFESGKGNRGTGLGLPVSRKILQEHGGTIQVESELGEGSCFALSFPAILSSEWQGPSATDGDAEAEDDPGDASLNQPAPAESTNVGETPDDAALEQLDQVVEMLEDEQEGSTPAAPCDDEPVECRES